MRTNEQWKALNDAPKQCLSLFLAVRKTLASVFFKIHLTLFATSDYSKIKQV